MVSEGHIVGNHSKTHPSMPTKTSNLENFNEELYDVEKLYKDVTGKDIVKFLGLLWENTQKKLGND